jgi:hypothetical protein
MRRKGRVTNSVTRWLHGFTKFSRYLSRPVVFKGHCASPKELVHRTFLRAPSPSLASAQQGAKCVAAALEDRQASMQTQGWQDPPFRSRIAVSAHSPHRTKTRGCGQTTSPQREGNYEFKQVSAKGSTNPREDLKARSALTETINEPI